MKVDRKYTGYRDSDSKGYTGIRSNIDFTKPESVCYQTNTWIGTDDVSSLVWVQIGWAYENKPSKRIADYAEVHRHDGGYNIYYFPSIIGGSTYEIEKSSGNAVWSIAGKQVHSESWSGVVGSGVMPNAQYTVEVFDPSCDYVPGSSTAKNYCQKIQTRVTGGDYAKAILATDQTNDPNGNAEKDTGSEDMWMAVWDTRAGSAMSAGSSLSPEAVTKEATPSITWAATTGTAPAPLGADDVANALNRYSQTGADALTSVPTVVELTDAFPFGAPEAQVVHQICLAEVEIKLERADEFAKAKVRVDLFLQANDPAIVSASTRSKPQWVAPTPGFPPADPEGELQRVGIHAMFDPTTRPNLTVEEVLAAIWRDMGVSPEAAGQIVMRPRTLEPSFPKTLKGGQMVPERPTGIYWIVEVRGTAIHEITAPGGERIGHQTGLVILVDDLNGDAFYGVGLP